MSFNALFDNDYICIYCNIVIHILNTYHWTIFSLDLHYVNSTVWWFNSIV